MVKRYELKKLVAKVLIVALILTNSGMGEIAVRSQELAVRDEKIAVRSQEVAVREDEKSEGSGQMGEIAVSDQELAVSSVESSDGSSQMGEIAVRDQELAVRDDESSDDRDQTVEVTEITEISETTENTEATEVSETTENTEATEVSETIETSETTETTEATETSELSDGCSQETEISETNETTENTEATETSELSDSSSQETEFSETNETTENAETIEIIETSDNIATVSDIDITDTADFDVLATDSIITDNNLLGAPQDQTITLDFGIYPRFDKANSNTWTNDGVTMTATNVWKNAWGYEDVRDKFVEIIETENGTKKYKYTISGNSEESVACIYNKFTGTKPPTITYGLGMHVALPNYDRGDSAVWEGYKFVGWLDKFGYNRMNSNSGTFEYAFQNSGDVTYTASWEKVYSAEYPLKINYYRDTKNGMSTDLNGGTFELIASASIIEKHGSDIKETIQTIPGYKIASYSIIDTTNNIATVNNTTLLKTYNVYGEYVDLKESTLSFNDKYDIIGFMPNHGITINFFFVPNEKEKTNVTINYYDEESGAKVKTSLIKQYKAEELFIATPAEVASCSYVRGVVVPSPTSTRSDVEFLNGQYPIGFFETIATLSSTDHKFDPKDDGGLKFFVPNQDIVINYYYTVQGEGAIVKYIILKETGVCTDEYATASETTFRCEVGMTEDRQQEVKVPNYENEGYGEPTLLQEGEIYLRSIQYEGGIGANDGKLKYNAKYRTGGSIILKYSYDITSDFFTKLEFNQYDDGHGVVSPKVGSLPFTSRYLPRKKWTKVGNDWTSEYINYDVNALIKDVVETHDDNYKLVWYENKASGIGKVGSPLASASNINLQYAQYRLFASFEEDPDCWIDIDFDSVDNCYLSGSTTRHIAKGTASASITYPKVNLAKGYIHKDNKWVDADNNALPNYFTESKTYYPVIELNANKSETPVKPITVVHTSSDGIGVATPFEAYDDRYYLLADADHKLVKYLSGINFKRVGFDALTPGSTYYVHEMMATNVSDIPAVDSIVDINGGTNISAGFKIFVPSLNNNYSLTNDNTTITITRPINGISYALLDDRYNVISNWSATNLTYTNLKKGTYYLVVAKETEKNYSETDASVINAGTVIFTETNDLSNRKYKLAVFGATAMRTTNGSANDGASNGSLYEVAAGTSITLTRTGDVGKWYVATNNVKLEGSLDVIQKTFTMPNEDVVIYNYVDNSTDYDNLTVYSDNGIGLINVDSAREVLTNDTNVQTAISNHVSVEHIVYVRKEATKKETIDAMTSDGPMAPYEWIVDIGTIIGGYPYENENVANVNLDCMYAFDKNVQGNVDFVGADKIYIRRDGSAYDDEELGAVKISLDKNDPKNLQWTKMHIVEVKSEKDATVSIKLPVKNNDDFTTANNYDSELVPKIGVSYWDDSGVTATSEYSAKEWLYKDIYDGDDENPYTKTTSIYKNTNKLTLKYELNEERETNKELLYNEIIVAENKVKKLKDAIVKQTLQTAIETAENVRDMQKSFTATEIYNAYLALKAVVDSTVDAATESEIVYKDVRLDANGGELNLKTIQVILGADQKYEELADVRISRKNWTFKGWNTKADGKGVTITKDTVVGDESSVNSTLYAIWKYTGSDSGNNNTDGGNSRGSGSSGGGGGGGIREIPGVLDYVAINPLTGERVSEREISDIFARNPQWTSTVMVEENKNGNTSFAYVNDATRIIIVNPLDNYNAYKNGWIYYHRNNTVTGDLYTTYRLDENGYATLGFYSEGKSCYYFDKDVGLENAALKTGWIYDKDTKNWYYANPLTGAIQVGWQNINGKDYYFCENTAYNSIGNLNIDNTNIASIGYGALLTNTTTPDGYYVNENGERLVYKP